MIQGSIQINNDGPIITWRAVRGESVGDDIHVYKCSAEQRDIHGYLRRGEFLVTHSYRKGAARLASKILSQIAKPGVMMIDARALYE